MLHEISLCQHLIPVGQLFMNIHQEVWVVLHKLLPLRLLDDSREVFDDHIFGGIQHLLTLATRGMLGHANDVVHL